jgi:hypothetical protein
MSSGSRGLQCRKNKTHPASPFSTKDRSFWLANNALCNLICCLEFPTFPGGLIPSPVSLKQAYRRVHLTQGTQFVTARIRYVFPEAGRRIRKCTCPDSPTKRIIWKQPWCPLLPSNAPRVRVRARYAGVLLGLPPNIELRKYGPLSYVSG